MERKSPKSSGFHKELYTYDELPRDGSFRCLILHRGTGNDPLKCSLQTAPLLKTKFEAISYVWGRSKKNKKIICDGRVIKITKSLSNVLRRLRLPHRRRKLWADGICINQNDLNEKGRQVAIMGAIYRSATCVLIYIGSEDHGHGPQVCSLLDDVNRMIDETCEQIDMSWGSFPYPEEDDPILSDSRWNSLGHLFQQDWFERGWVVREAAFAQYGLVIWHQSEFSWETLMRVHTWLRKRAYQLFLNIDRPPWRMICHYGAFEQQNEAFVQVFDLKLMWRPRSLLENLNHAKEVQLSDDRDRIYAFLELSESSERVVTIQPDYNLAPLEVYRQFAMQYIREAKDTRVLDYVEHKLDPTNLDIPSWIPCWNVRTWSIATATTLHTVFLSSRDGSFCEPKILNDEVLSVRGVITDSVKYISDTFELDSTTPQTVGELWRAINHMLEYSPYEPSHRLGAFLDALDLGVYVGEWSHWRLSRAALMAYIQVEHEGLIPSELSHQEYPSSKNGNYSTLYLDCIKRMMYGNRFIVTERGYIGLAPAVAQKDDSCGIIFGCQTPCVLRPSPRDKYYKFLGATVLRGKQFYETDEGDIHFEDQLGHEDSKDWVEWDVEEQDIYLV